MHSSKLIQVLKKLSKEDLKNCRNYLSSPLFHGRPGVKMSLALFKLIEPHAPEYISKKLKKEQVFKKLYPGQTFKNGKLEKQMSTLLGLVQKYIVYQNAELDNAIYQLRLLAKYYRKHQLHGMADQCEKKYRRLLQKETQKDATYYYDAICFSSLKAS